MLNLMVLMVMQESVHSTAQCSLRLFVWCVSVLGRMWESDFLFPKSIWIYFSNVGIAYNPLQGGVAGPHFSITKILASAIP
jgi:hypothetical protein